MKWNYRMTMTIENNINYYAKYDYMNVYLRYGFADISTGGLFNMNSENINEDLYNFLDLDI